MKIRSIISLHLRKLAHELVNGVARSPTQQYVYYQEADMGYPTTTEEGAGKHMNSPGGHEFSDTNEPNSESNYEDDIVHPIMTIRTDDREDYEPDTDFHTSVYAQEGKDATAPWGEEYARPRDGGLGIYAEPSTKPEGSGQDARETEEGRVTMNSGAPHDYSMGDQDSNYLFFDRAKYPTVPRG